MKVVMKNSFFLLIAFCLFVLSACDKDVDAKKTDPVVKAEAMRKLPKLLDFGAKKCISCKMMSPIFNELTKEYKGAFDVEFIDVWRPENKEKAKRYGIRSIPTQIFFDANGKELWRHKGFMSKEDILKKWKVLGFTFKAVEQENAPEQSAIAESV